MVTHQEFFKSVPPDVTGHPYLLDHFPWFDYRNPKDPSRLDMRRPDNTVGFWQRSCLTWHAVEMCGKTGEVGIEFGSAGVKTPWCLSTDIRTGLRSHYPPEMPVGVREIVRGHLRVDGFERGFSRSHHDPLCDDTEIVFGLAAFASESFSLVAASHVLEHVPGDPIETLTAWARLLRPGGKIVCVIPDQRWGDVLRMDPDHKHAWTGSEFLAIAKRVPGLEVIEHTAETQINYHSFATVWKKR